ncbi:MAG: glycosyltransferase [Cyanobium sp.]
MSITPLPPVPPDPAAARALLKAEEETLRTRKQAGLLDSSLAWLEELQKVLGDEPSLVWFQLELSQHAMDLPQQVALSRQLLLHRQQPPESALAHLRKLHFEALLGLAHGAGPADAALAALPGGTTPERQWQRLRQAALLAQHRYRFATARALLVSLDALCGDDTAHAPRLEALERAERLALMEGLLAEALRIRDRIRVLLETSENPEQRRRVGAEPMRQWRLEIGANPAALDELEASRTLPAAAACQALATSLERHPDSTALAFGLLLALRRAGWVGATVGQVTGQEQGQDTGEQDPIPKRLWLLRRHPAPSEDLAELEQRWRQLHPDWELHWLDHQLEPQVPHDAEQPQTPPLPPLVQAACRCVNDPAIRGDLLRLALLWQHGGVAVDWNSRCQRPLSELLAGASLLLVQDADGAIGSDLFAATPRHPWVKEALEQGCRNALGAQGYSRWDVSGASLLSVVFARWSRATIATGPRPAGLRLVSVHELRHWLGLSLPLPRPEQVPEEAPFTQLFQQQRRRLALAGLRQ